MIMKLDINKKDSKLIDHQNWISIINQTIIIQSNQIILTAEKEVGHKMGEVINIS